MQTRRDRFLCFFFLVVLVAWGAISAQILNPDSVIRQIDHIMLNVDEPEQLFRFFSEKLGLPVAWPFQPYGTFSSGGLSFGNVNIELLHRQGLRSGLLGVAFEPSSVSEAVAGLDARGLKHSAPGPVYLKDSSGKEHLAYTNIVMRLPPAPASYVFFCKYSDDLAWCPFCIGTIDEGRAKLRRELQSHGGGALGVESAAELVVGVRDVAAAQRDWSALLGPARSGSEPLWQIGQGPAIRLIAAEEDRIAQLRVKVKSIERARAFLKAEDLLGDDHGREISLKPSRVVADIRLVQ